MPIRYEIRGDIDDRKKKLIEDAFEEVTVELEGLVKLCNPKGLYLRGGHTEEEKAAFKKWFGSYKDGRKVAWDVYNKIYQHKGKLIIKPDFDRRNLLDPGFQDNNLDTTHAFTRKEEGRCVITLCPMFYEVSSSSRIYTFIHELTHYFADTEDFDLNATTAKKEAIRLAKYNPDDARNCAYNFEFFARYVPEEKMSEFEEERKRREFRFNPNNENKSMTRSQFNKH